MFAGAAIKILEDLGSSILASEEPWVLGELHNLEAKAVELVGKVHGILGNEIGKAAATVEHAAPGIGPEVVKVVEDALGTLKGTIEQALGLGSDPVPPAPPAG